MLRPTRLIPLWRFFSSKTQDDTTITFHTHSFGFLLPKEDSDNGLNPTDPIVLQRLKKVAQQEAKLKAIVNQQKQIEIKKAVKKIAKAKAQAIQKQQQKSILEDKTVTITEKFVRGSGKGGQSNFGAIGFFL